jgi:uncharacterized LabA/DUF88 family protein
MRTYVYVDGFNVYYGAVKGTPYRWLNIKQLVEQLIPPTYKIQKIKYFTARVSGSADPDAPRRQRIYFNALQTIPEIEIHFGSFLSKTIWRPIVNLPVGNETIRSPTPVVLPPGQHQVTGARVQTLVVGNYPPRGQPRTRNTTRPLPDALIAEVHTMEEKGSDVNLAAHLINDAWKDLFDAAVVMSNDTDLVTSIAMVTQERKKPVFVVCPGRWAAAPKLVNIATYTRHIRSAMLAKAQFPSPIPTTTIRKPPTW